MHKTLKLFIALAVFLAALMWADSLAKGPMETVQVHHTVASGEVLWHIASKYMGQQDGTDELDRLIWDIRQANKIDDPARLCPGQVLVIPLQRRIR